MIFSWKDVRYKIAGLSVKGGAEDKMDCCMWSFGWVAPVENEFDRLPGGFDIFEKLGFGERVSIDLNVRARRRYRPGSGFGSPR